jgi:thiol-disulfide isomerase/thioredoxin
MQKIIIALFMCINTIAIAQTIQKDRIIYGTCTKDSLLQAPFDKWFNINYNDYTPNTTIETALKKSMTKDISIKIFFGTWCGDSKREVSRFYKVLSNIGFDQNKTQLIALGNADSLYKLSTNGYEKGVGIFRVPVFIVYKNGKELNRINEFPVVSLEKDLLAIINNENYTPNYASFNTINNWLLNGTLLDDNTNVAGLANSIKSKVNSEYDLNSLGYLLLKHQLKKEALKLFKINYNLFPTSANVMSSLGEGFLENNDKVRAVTMLEFALQENINKEAFKEILALLYRAKGL